MIVAMLQPNADNRPNINALFKFDFLANNFVPKTLPSSCLTMAPREMELDQAHRKPLLEINENFGKIRLW